MIACDTPYLFWRYQNGTHIMQLKSLRLFLAVADTGSFIAAAERLHTVQSNVTAHIKKLENELGVQLFDRNNRSMLTAAGSLLHEHALRIVQAHDQAIAQFSQLQPGGHLRIGAMETTTALHLPAILSDFHRHNPGIDLQLTTAPTADLTRGLNEGRFDCVFVAGSLEQPGTHQRKAFSERLVLVSARPLIRLPTPEELLSASFLGFRQGCSYRQRIELLLARFGINATRIIEFGSLDAILGCCAAGMGFALLPASVVQAHQHRFVIHALELPEDIACVDTYFIAGITSSWTPALNAFAQCLEETLATGSKAIA